MATLYKTDGTQEEKTPANGIRFTLEELQGFVGGLIEFIDLGEGWMIVNEEGKLIDLPFNPKATRIARPVLFAFDPGVFGDVLVMSIKEADEGDEEEEDQAA